MARSTRGSAGTKTAKAEKGKDKKEKGKGKGKDDKGKSKGKGQGCFVCGSHDHLSAACTKRFTAGALTDATTVNTSQSSGATSSLEPARPGSNTVGSRQHAQVPNSALAPIPDESHEEN